MASAFVTVLLLAGIPSSSSPGPETVPNIHRELVTALLEESLQHELTALESVKATHYGTRDEYRAQLQLRGRVGHTSQAERLADAVMAKHEDRNRERSRKHYHDLIQRYQSPAESTTGQADMIAAGQLEEVDQQLREAAARPFDTSSHPSGFRSDEFWLSCKLAVAYYAEKKIDQTHQCLNLARRFREGPEAGGESFDADDQWLPEMPEHTTGFGLAAADQSRATFLATLLQTGHSELAVSWFLARNGRPQFPEHQAWSSAFENTRRLIGLLARCVSTERALKVTRTVFGKKVPAEVYAAVISGGLQRGDRDSVRKAVEEAAHSLEYRTSQWGYGYATAIRTLFEHNEVNLAHHLLQAIVDRLRQHVEARTSADTADLQVSLWNDALSHHVIVIAQAVDIDLATELIRLGDRLPPARHEDSTVRQFGDHRLDIVRVYCGIADEQQVARLTRSSRSPEVIDALLSTRRLTAAHSCLDAAAEDIGPPTSSGASVGGDGLAVMGSNPHLRIRLARRAIDLNKLHLARQLIDEIPNQEARREAYRAVTLRIARREGIPKAMQWLQDTADPISKSGGNLGLVEFLAPEPKDADEIPRPWNSAC